MYCPRRIARHLDSKPFTRRALQGVLLFDGEQIIVDEAGDAVGAAIRVYLFILGYRAGLYVETHDIDLFGLFKTLLED